MECSADYLTKELWYDINGNVEKGDWYTNTYDCLQSLSEKKMSLIKDPLILYNDDKFVVSRNGDLAVGLLLDQDAGEGVDIKVSIGGVDVCTLHLVPGIVTYFVEGTHILPIISIQYSEIQLRPSSSLSNVSIIYALLGTECRRKLATSTNIMHLQGRDAITRGHFGFVNDLHKYLHEYPDYNGSYIVIPSMNDVKASVL